MGVRSRNGVRGGCEVAPRRSSAQSQRQDAAKGDTLMPCAKIVGGVRKSAVHAPSCVCAYAAGCAHQLLQPRTQYMVAPAHYTCVITLKLSRRTYKCSVSHTTAKVAATAPLTSLLLEFVVLCASGELQEVVHTLPCTLRLGRLLPERRAAGGGVRKRARAHSPSNGGVPG